MLRIIIIALFVLMGCESEKTIGSIQIQSNIDTTVARIGDIIKLDIAAQNVGDKIIKFPDLSGTESMEIRAKTVQSDKNIPFQVSFNIVFWDTGSFTIPEYTVLIFNADSTEDVAISTDPIDITILSMVSEAQDKALRPIKDPVAIKSPINWSRWLLALLLLLLLLILLRLWRERIKKQAFEEIEVSDFKSAREIAINRLSSLEGLINSGDKEFYSQASFILREFIENHYYIRALEMTTGEIIDFETDFDLTKVKFSELIKMLKRADLAKFAQYMLTLKDRTNDFKWLQSFILNFDDSNTD